MTSLLATALLVLTYPETNAVTGERRPSLLLRYMGGALDIEAFDDSHLIPKREILPQGKNGLDDLVEAMSLLPLDGGAADTKRLRQMGSGREDWDTAAVEKIIAARAEMFLVLDRMLAKPRIQFPMVTHLTHETGSELFKSMNFSAYLNARVRLHVVKKEWKAALVDLRASNEFARRLVECEGSLVHYLVGLASESSMLRELEFILNDPSLPAGSLADLVPILEAGPNQVSAREFTWKNEYLIVHNLVADLKRGFGFHEIQGLGGNGEERRGWDDVIRNCAEQLMITVLFQPNLTRREAGRCFDYLLALAACDRVARKEIRRPERFDRIQERKWKIFVSRNAVGNMLLRALLPAHERVFDRMDLVACNREVLRVMAALRSFDARRGELPESLVELVPDFLAAPVRDPFSGELFRYSKKDRLLWTPGADGIDGKGHPKGRDPGRYFTDNRRWQDPTIRLRWIDE